MIELELLAISWAAQKLRHFLQGRDFTVSMDHKPLVGLMDKPLANVDNARMASIRAKLTPFNFKLDWLPGIKNVVADVLSRSPVESADEDEQVAATESAACFALAAGVGSEV